LIKAVRAATVVSGIEALKSSGLPDRINIELLMQFFIRDTTDVSKSGRPRSAPRRAPILLGLI